MKTATLREVKAKLSGYLQIAQDERVLITSHGAPVAVLVGVAGRDMTEIVARYDERFARALERAARGPMTAIEDLRTELGLPVNQKRGRRAGTVPPRRRARKKR